MKCINCNIDNTLKDRVASTGRCKSCDRQFVFEPTLMPESERLTDTFFAQLVSDVSAKDTLFFTQKQLYYLLNKRLRSRSSGANNWWKKYTTGYYVFFLLIFSNYAIESITAKISDNPQPKIADIVLSITFGIFLLLSWSAIGKIFKNSVLDKFIRSSDLGIWINSLSQNRNSHQGKPELDRLVIDRTKFDTWLDRWTSINNQPLKILPPPQTFSLPAAPNPQVTAYSFDRVVVCDTPEIAQLLISNNFHFEHNCAILTIDGYPHSIFDTTMEMLHRNPDLQVYAFHNCTPKGIELTHRLRAEEKWFPNPTIPIIDVGILPRQIMDNLNVSILQSTESAEISQRLSPYIRASLNPAEVTWLDTGCYLDLESFSPQKLIRILQQAISQSQRLKSIEEDSNAINSEGSYTLDSFG
jgi:hypothetical protein